MGTGVACAGRLLPVQRQLGASLWPMMGPARATTVTLRPKLYLVAEGANGYTMMCVSSGAWG